MEEYPFHTYVSLYYDKKAMNHLFWCSNKFGPNNIRGIYEKYLTGSSAFVMRFKKSEDLVWYELHKDSIK